MPLHSQRTRRRVSASLIVSAIAVSLGACGTPPKASSDASNSTQNASATQTEPAKTTVLVTDRGCEPADLTLRLYDSARAVEW